MKAFLLRFALAACSPLAAQLFGQSESPPFTQTINYLKIPAGKSQEFLQFTREGTMKVAQMRANAGEIVSWTLVRCVLPGGEEAHADYAISTLTTGIPPEPATRSQLEAALRKVGIDTPVGDYIARRSSVSTLVSTEMWQVRERVGAPQKGHYLYINSMRVHDSAAYVDFEKKVWRPIAEQFVKDGAMSGWLFATKILPSGTDSPYLARSVDMFPSWQAAMSDRPLEPTFKKAHPGKDYNPTLGGMDKLRSLAKRELWVVVERVEKQK